MTEAEHDRWLGEQEKRFQQDYGEASRDTILPVFEATWLNYITLLDEVRELREIIGRDDDVD